MIRAFKNSATRKGPERARNFFTELKWRNLYKLAVSFVPCGETSPLFELARVLVHFNHVASGIVNAVRIELASATNKSGTPLTHNTGRVVSYVVSPSKV